MVRRIGTVGSPTPRPDPCGRQAPALQDSGPISRYGACVRSRELGGLSGPPGPTGAMGTIYSRTNRSSWLPPAHQGMKSRSCGLVQRISTADSATPHPDPCGGQAPALHFLIPPSAIGLQFGAFRPWRAGIEVDWRAHFRTNRSCRLAPAHQGMKSRSCGLVQRIGTADSATPHPDPCGGQAPALHFLIPPSAIGLQFATFRPWRAGIEVDWRAHPGSESGTCFRTNDELRGRNDEGVPRIIDERLLELSIFVPMTRWTAGEGLAAPSTQGASPNSPTVRG